LGAYGGGAWRRCIGETLLVKLPKRLQERKSSPVKSIQVQVESKSSPVKSSQVQVKSKSSPSQVREHIERSSDRSTQVTQIGPLT